SEERRIGGKGRFRGGPEYLKKKKKEQDREGGKCKGRLEADRGTRAGVDGWSGARSKPPAAERRRQSALAQGCFFFQAEDGIRDWSVTGVQTCALPIWESIRTDRSAATWPAPDPAAPE